MRWSRSRRSRPRSLAAAGAGDAAALDKAEGTILATLAAGQRSARQRPSMGQDMMKGRQTEIDQINGFVVAEGARPGLRRRPTPRWRRW